MLHMLCYGALEILVTYCHMSIAAIASLQGGLEELLAELGAFIQEQRDDRREKNENRHRARRNISYQNRLYTCIMHISSLQ